MTLVPKSGESSLDDVPRRMSTDSYQVCCRLDGRHARYVSEHLERGWRAADFVRRVLSAQLVLETCLGPHLGRLESWAVREKVVLPRGCREVGDASWLSEAVAKLALERLEQLEQLEQVQRAATGRK